MWDSGLTKQNIEDLERTQKCFAKLVLQENYISYKSAIKSLGIETLAQRRKFLTLTFAQTSLADGILHDLFPLNKKKHHTWTRKSEYFQVTHANTHRFKNSPIITMQKLLNIDKNQQEWF